MKVIAELRTFSQHFLHIFVFHCSLSMTPHYLVVQCIRWGKPCFCNRCVKNVLKAVSDNLGIVEKLSECFQAHFELSGNNRNHLLLPSIYLNEHSKRLIADFPLTHQNMDTRSIFINIQNNRQKIDRSVSILWQAN